MSARICLLCGKTLVRIRVGAGGDFCSREHRNQYQLRRGMDCLAEANKVSTLARRRETPKALFGEACAGSSSEARRAFLMTAPFGLVAGLKPNVRRLREGDRVALFPRGVVFAAPVPAVASLGVRRQFGTTFGASTAPAAVPRGPSAGWKPASFSGGKAGGLRGIAVSAATGNALRVSSSAGFRLRAASPPRAAYAARTDRDLVAGIRARAGQRPFALRQDCQGAPGDGRLAFVDMGFSSAPDATARLDWLAADNATSIGRERREL
jgi:hypothetical protein